MNVFFLPLYAVGFVYTLWLFFLACMSLQRAYNERTLSNPAYFLGLPVLAVGVVLDAFVNIVFASVLFAERPKEWMVSQRVSRLQQGEDWRATIAKWVCENLLNTFDPSGRHCK